MLSKRLKDKIARILGESAVTCELTHGSAFVSLYVVHGRRRYLISAAPSFNINSIMSAFQARRSSDAI